MLGMFYEVKKKVTPEPDNSSHFSVWVVIDESLIDAPVVFTQINNAPESYLMEWSDLKTVVPSGTRHFQLYFLSPPPSALIL